LAIICITDASRIHAIYLSAVHRSFVTSLHAGIISKQNCYYYVGLHDVVSFAGHRKKPAMLHIVS